MQTICSIAASILVLAGPAECKTPADGVAYRSGATNVHYAGSGLPRLPTLPRLPSVPRLPSMPRVPKAR